MNSEADDQDFKAATEQILNVKRIHEEELLAKPNVVGVGIGFRHWEGLPTESLALVVMVTKKIPQRLLAPEDIIPISIEGIPIDVQEVGEISAQ